MKLLIDLKVPKIYGVVMFAIFKALPSINKYHDILHENSQSNMEIQAN